MGYVATKSRPRYLDTDLKAEFAGDNPDYFDVKTNKWYSTSGGVSVGATLTIGSELTPRNYLNNIVYADHNGQPEYVEEVAKVEYKDIIKANEYKGKNACTAWVNFDGTTTPPTIRDSYNVSSVVIVGTGLYDVYFATPMDNVNYNTSVTSNTYSTTEATLSGVGGGGANTGSGNVYTTSIVRVMAGSAPYVGRNNIYNSKIVNVQVYGGKN